MLSLYNDKKDVSHKTRLAGGTHQEDVLRLAFSVLVLVLISSFQQEPMQKILTLMFIYVTTTLHDNSSKMSPSQSSLQYWVRCLYYSKWANATCYNT